MAVDVGTRRGLVTGKLIIKKNIAKANTTARHNESFVPRLISGASNNSAAELQKRRNYYTTEVKQNLTANQL